MQPKSDVTLQLTRSEIGNGTHWNQETVLIIMSGLALIAGDLSIRQRLIIEVVEDEACRAA